MVCVAVCVSHVGVCEFVTFLYDSRCWLGILAVCCTLIWCRVMYLLLFLWLLGRIDRAIRSSDHEGMANDNGNKKKNIGALKANSSSPSPISVRSIVLKHEKSNENPVHKTLYPISMTNSQDSTTSNSNSKHYMFHSTNI